MPAPLSDNTIVQMIFRGTIATNDQVVNPLENVQWYQYFKSLTPDPAGVTVKDIALRAATAWATAWRTFQADDFFYFSCTCRAVGGFTAVPPNRYKAVLGAQWTDNSVKASGTAGTNSSPSFNAFAIRKLTSVPGRGKQGQIRVPGVPVAGFVDNTVDPLVLAALTAALTPTSLNLAVGGVGFGDFLQPVVIDGKLVNTNPLHPPPFYAEVIEGFTPSPLIATQVTRKLGRRRS